MEHLVRKILKWLGLYITACRVFLPKQTFVIEPFVYLDGGGNAVKNDITDKVRWLEKCEIEAECRELAEREFFESRDDYKGYSTSYIWLF